MIQDNRFEKTTAALLTPFVTNFTFFTLSECDQIAYVSIDGLDSKSAEPEQEEQQYRLSTIKIVQLNNSNN